MPRSGVAVGATAAQAADPARRQAVSAVVTRRAKRDALGVCYRPVCPRPCSRGSRAAACPQPATRVRTPLTSRELAARFARGGGRRRAAEVLGRGHRHEWAFDPAVRTASCSRRGAATIRSARSRICARGRSVSPAVFVLFATHWHACFAPRGPRRGAGCGRKAPGWRTASISRARSCARASATGRDLDALAMGRRYPLPVSSAGERDGPSRSTSPITSAAIDPPRSS